MTGSILKISTEFFITTFCQSKANLHFSFSQLFSSLKHCICFPLENVCGTVADKGKPWFMYEAFQHIMKAQVEFLIGLGVNPALKVPCEFLLIIIIIVLCLVFLELRRCRKIVSSLFKTLEGLKRIPVL